MTELLWLAFYVLNGLWLLVVFLTWITDKE